MAKTMTVINPQGTVLNIISCSDREAETDTRKNAGDYPAAIGDTWQGGKFYRDGKRILSLAEEFYAADTERRELIESMAQMVEEVYSSDLEMMTE